MFRTRMFPGSSVSCFGFRCLTLLAAAIALNLVAAAPAWSQFDSPLQGDQKLGKSETKKWQIGLDIRALGGPCGGLTGTIPVPTDWPEQEVRIASEDISKNVVRVNYRTLPSGIKQMTFAIPELRSGESAKALLTVEITKREILPPDDPSRLKIPERLPKELLPYLGPSPFIDVRSSTIQGKLREAIAGKDSAWSQVEAICDWVRANVELQRGSGVKGGAEVIRAKAGSHEDLTGLFIALCRANKIPARTVWIPDHSYAEFYLESADGKGAWYPCMVAGEKMFGQLTDLRPILQKGENISVPEHKDPQRFVAEFLKGKSIKGGGRPEITVTRKMVP